MDSKRFSFIYELVSTLIILPVMIGAIIKSLQLIPLSYTEMATSFAISSYSLIWIVFIILQLNMILAIASIVILFVNLGLIRESIRIHNIKTIENWAGWTIKLCALSNIAVTWFLDKYYNVATDVKPAIILWTITLCLSIVYSLYAKLQTLKY